MTTMTGEYHDPNGRSVPSTEKEKGHDAMMRLAASQ
jgi:hypothetical protein